MSAQHIASPDPTAAGRANGHDPNGHDPTALEKGADAIRHVTRNLSAAPGGTPRSAWPACLWLVRHGESAGNVARDAAYAADLPLIDIAPRDVDVSLSGLGERQARSLGRWFGRLPVEERPTAILTSPYVRAIQTTELLCAEAGLDPDAVGLLFDERLREKEFGILDRYTRRGISERQPEQAALRLRLGKFYHRPPGGESWCDVILRLRSFLDSLSREHHGQRVLLVCHSVVVLCFRYLLERLTEQQILEIDRVSEVANCSVTRYTLDEELGRLVLREYNTVVPLEEEGAPVTAEQDVRAPAP